MTVRDIEKLFDPDELIAVMGPGLKNVFYTGAALHIREREDLMSKEVVRIGKDLINESIRLCIYVRMEQDHGETQIYQS